MTSHAIDRAEIRATIKTRRRDLTPDVISTAADALCRNLLGCEEFAQAQSLAAYLAMPGEMDLTPTIAAAWAACKQVLLPLIDGPRMNFVAFTPTCAVQRGPFGLRQPLAVSPVVDPRLIDLVLVPLVAFDDRGCRLGMGGGYYDRTFEFRRLGLADKPRLAGVAFAFQQVDRLSAEPWDVPLDLIVTDRAVIRPRTEPQGNP